ncbi:DUF1295 domain-containing protein [Streptomyces sp. NPDC006617]|uniref:DUF1295 domain-containing protein n=1 Tax=Streptomyces sp. NPDC006617 TaxID=3155354 RepID=UPI0033B1DA6D
MNGFPRGGFAAGLGWAAAAALAVMLAPFAVAVRKGVHRVVDVAEAMLAKARGNRNLYALRMVYLVQGALVWLVPLPVQAASYGSGFLSVLAWTGAVVWAVGLAFEAVGDAQLARFKADPANRGRIMDRGLWSWTRYPNYFGDFCVWWGLFLIACDAGLAAAAVSVVSPLVMTYLLIGGSGKRLLERHMADRPGCAAYAARTSGFFPRPPRRSAPRRTGLERG